MYRVEITKRAQKEMRKIHRAEQPKLLAAMEGLKHDPRPTGATKLSGSPFWRIRVGDYRIIYDVEDDRLRILVVRVRHRREAYR